jgi:Tol biopolymer transport system component
VLRRRSPSTLSALAIAAVLTVLGCNDRSEKGVPLEQRWLAFALSHGVYQAKADGSEMKRLTDIRGFEYQPDWSPDGRKLLLRVDAVEGKPGGGVYVATVGRTRAVNLSKISGVFGGDPDWSPDGKEIAFVGKRKNELHGASRGRRTRCRDLVADVQRET